MTALPILVVEHERDDPAGWVGDWLQEAGARLDVRRPYAGEPLPDDLAGHAGMLVMGGEMGADDDADHPWLTGVKQLVRGAGATPVLGICLGHQLVAVAHGGTVERNPCGQQIGLLRVGWSGAAADDPLLGAVVSTQDEPPVAVQWNDDLVTVLPSAATALARTPSGELQAARFGAVAWGVQWHPEVGADTLQLWADGERDATPQRRSEVAHHLEQVRVSEDRLRTTWRPLAVRFAELCGVSVQAGAP